MSIQQAVSNSSPNTIKETMQSLHDLHFIEGRWLGPRNHYARQTIERIDMDFQATPTRPVPAKKHWQLCQYVTASAILHCTDGWSYLAHSIGSLLNGDLATAIHMAYYAELRAAISFLAINGIGIFNNKHCWIDSSGKGHFFKVGNTHPSAWQAITTWTNDLTNSAKVLDLVTVNGIRLGDWLRAAGYAPTAGSSIRLAAEWLKDWSIDLKKLESDRYLRNDASYRPQRLLRNEQGLPVVSTLRSIIEIWQGVEPTVSGQFSILDIHLLREALARAYRMRTGRSSSGELYMRHISTVLDALACSQMEPSMNLLSDAEHGNRI